MTETAFQPLLRKIGDGVSLSFDEAARAFQILMNGGATPAQMGALLMGLKLKGETAAEIGGAAAAMRAKALPFPAASDAIDCCGTGGDGRNSLNISTAVAFVLAACGVPVVKHGNRATSSACGSADVLEALGVKIDAEPTAMSRTLAQHNIAFLLAPRYHPAMRHVAPVRQELKLRTIFNLLGPLANPAQPKRQLLGVYAPEWVDAFAHVLQRLELTHAWVVHGANGTDELSISGASQVAELKGGEIRHFEITPEEAGLPRHPAEALSGGGVEHNAQKLRQLLMGERSAYRDAVVLNASAGLVIAEKAGDLREGAAMAAAVLEEGAAYTVLQHFAEATHATLSSRTK